MTLRVGLVDRFPIIYLNNVTGTVDGIYGSIIRNRIGIITKGLNVTFYVGGHSNRGCQDGVCKEIAAFIQSGKADLCSESSQMFLFDDIYKNISLSPPVLELDCTYLSYGTKKPARNFNDILTSLQVFSPSTILFLVALLIILFACKNLPLWLYYIKRRNSGLAEIINIQFGCDKSKSTEKPDVELPKTWYSASFQTNLVSLIQTEPVSSLDDLLDRKLQAHVAATSNCYRGLFHGKNSVIDPRVNNSMIVSRTVELRKLSNTSFAGHPMVVFLGNKHEIARIRKSFSENPTIYNPKEVRIKTTTILDVYMYRDDLPKEKENLLLSRFHAIMAGELFHDKNTSLYQAEEAQEYHSKVSTVGFQSLKMENYRYVFTLYTLFIVSLSICFAANKLIQSVADRKRVSRSILSHSTTSTKSTNCSWREEISFFTEQ
uniref:Uncharacterized protein n=1 Tax=Tetranychus urticae TaxID=32264 RepID=T1K6A7_TETUR